MFGKRKKPQVIPYDKSGKVPVIRSSRKFEELMLICGEKDLSEFLSQYQVEESEIKREW